MNSWQKMQKFYAQETFLQLGGRLNKNAVIRDEVL